MGTHLIRRAAFRGATFFLTGCLLVPPVWAQPAALPPGVAAPAAGSPTSTAERLRLATEAAEAQANQMLASPSATAAATAAAPPTEKKIDLWELAIGGGVLMIPIVAGSVIVVCFAFERALALRRRKLLPPPLVAELGELSRRPGGLDPRAVYRACLRYPSSAATILRAVLLKVGRPYAELELTLKELNEREAARLYKNVRPIELQISVAPLLGLLGTVQGMIMAFFRMASGETGNRAADLAEGIYIALVTTFAGLCVAIPAAAIAHYFEGKIQALFRDSDELILGLLPNFERFEGKLRVNRQTLSGEGEHAAEAPPPLPERAPVKVPK